MKKLLVFHPERDEESAQQYLAEAKITIGEGEIFSANTPLDAKDVLDNNRIDVIVAIASSEEDEVFQMTSWFLGQMEMLQSLPDIYKQPKILVINTGHYHPKEHAQVMIEANFPMPMAKHLYAETMTDAMELLHTEPIDMIVTVTNTEKLRQETNFVLAKMDDLRGADNISENGITLDKASRMVTVDDKAIKLSKIEARLLEIFMARPGNPLGTEFILSQVWGENDPGDTYLVRSAIKRLRNKIEPDPSNPTYILTWGTSYKLGSKTL
jgi:hypothetical protein